MWLPRGGGAGDGIDFDQKVQTANYKISNFWELMYNVVCCL